MQYVLLFLVCVTIFSIGNKFQPVSNFTELLKPPFLMHSCYCVISLCCPGASVQDDVLSSLETKLLDVSSELVRDSEGMVKC